MSDPTPDTTRQTVEEILQAFKRYPYGNPEYPHMTGAEALAAIELHYKGKMLEVIGTDEQYVETRSLTNDAVDNVGISNRNRLRAEQRERLALLGNKGEKQQ